MNKITRDTNALRGLYGRWPRPRTMAQILLDAGEGIQPAVYAMVERGELMTVTIDGQNHFDVGMKLKPYRPKPG